MYLASNISVTLYIPQRYESWTPEERALAQAGESTLFWAVLIGNQTIWTLLAFISIFK